MSADWISGIKSICSHWRHGLMLQQTLDTLEREFADDSDANIDDAIAAAFERLVQPLIAVASGASLGARFLVTLRMADRLKDEVF